MFENPWHRRLKQYVLYCLENDNLKTVYLNPMSTERIVLVWSIKYVVTITKEFAYSYSDRELDVIFEDGNAIPHKNVYIRKINLQKR